MKNRPVSRLLSAALLCVGLGSCTFSEHLARSAVDYNQSAEVASNQVLLTNVVRAMKKRPLAFSAISVLRGNVSSSLAISGKIPFGRTPNTEFSISPSLMMSTNPNVEIKPINTQEFMRGFATEISFDLLAALWEQGWSKQILFNLLIERIELGEDHPHCQKKGCPVLEAKQPG